MKYKVVYYPDKILQAIYGYHFDTNVSPYINEGNVV